MGRKESNQTNKTIKHHTQESQEVSLFSAGDHKAKNKQTRKHDKHETQITKMIHKRSTALERSVKKSYWRANLTDYIKLETGLRKRGLWWKVFWARLSMADVLINIKIGNNCKHFNI